MPTDQGLKPSRVEALALKVLLTDMSRVLEAPPVRTNRPVLAPGEVGELVVSARPNGLYAILDGNRRAALLRMTRGDLHVVNCQVYEGLTADQEAEIAAALHGPANAPVPAPAAARTVPDPERKPTPLERFLARRDQGDQVAKSITKLAASLGWEISHRQTTGNIIAVASLERIYRSGEPGGTKLNPLVLWQTLYTVTRAWDYRRDAVNGDVLLGIGLALLRADGGTDLEELIEHLARYRGGPRQVLSNARKLREHVGGTVAEAVAEIVTALTNPYS